ncbi:MAG: DNA methyltransferase [Thermoguttaceae bacterium]|jgi:DNA modification methylase
MKNTLYYGDNLEVLRRYIPDESVDLIYLDPPFNSDQNYNVLFSDQNGSQSAAQIQAFEDTWHWDQTAVAAYLEVVEAGGKVSLAMQAFRQALGDNDMLAYLSMMAPRLIELKRVLKSTGSVYLHCDPTASHYLKFLMDAVFGPVCFGNEIIWQRTNAKGLAFTRFARNHDIILRYTHSDKWTWNPSYTAHNPDYIKQFYKYTDADGRRYRLADLTNLNKNRPNLTYEFLGITRVWRWTKERMEDAYRKGVVVQTKPGGVPALKRYLDEQEGTPVGDVWTDIRPVQSQAAERLGYPTQKPEALLERIINASSNKGDVVLDPFCGCGTAISVAQKLDRKWIGIDITRLAVTLMKHRLRDAFGLGIGKAYDIIGEPVDLSGAKTLVSDDPYQFQWWALGLVGARPVEQKKGADKGIDGRIFFHDDAESRQIKQVVISVKAGGVQVSHIRDLRGVVEREKAAIGLLICLNDPMRPMRSEAAGAGFYESPWQTKHPIIQILTIEELLTGKTIDIPPSRDIRTFKKAPKAKKKPSGGMQNMFIF